MEKFIRFGGLNWLLCIVFMSIACYYEAQTGDEAFKSLIWYCFMSLINGILASSTMILTTYLEINYEKDHNKDN